ncbi:RimJ/RimL family protein N-acetyltransferase [Nitrospirillum amazonense]|uniref:RimJ/RimL family protein N-acetyltransferase n=1 Tax=Nitrospirillum amazonense TaxID=28077 RepID=A0A560EMW5_9PROT|nr:GNAT family N-acetyltransferase [Nitrospirillum amazonense]TWB10723.1 RimJ/RimL family protein N-acetyltransferase [Nitrospirillum amazonense]
MTGDPHNRAAGTVPYVSGIAPRCLWEGDTLVVKMGGTVRQRWLLDQAEGGPVLAFLHDMGGAGSRTIAALAALDAALTRAGDPPGLGLALPADLRAALEAEGVLTMAPGGVARVLAAALYQKPELWLRGPGGSLQPQVHTLSHGRYHPRRPAKVPGLLYERRIPWLDRTLSFRLADMDRDLSRFHAWMNDPRVAAFWQEEGELEQHRAYLENQLEDPHTLPLIASLDGEAFGYFEVYWAKENRIGAFYDAQDYDRGWHVLIGDESVRGKAYVSAWLPSLVHFMFLDDVRTQRIVGEPRADHHQQIRNLDRSGFAKVKEFNFPHKRALLVMLLRERFFDDRLWLPRAEPAPKTGG